MHSLPPVAIGIPTYRRPVLLARLLDSLQPEIEGREVLEVVADNAPGPDSIAPAVTRDHSPGAMCIPVPEPGISAARNALIRAALDRSETWRWLVMLDDDGYVEPGWLEALITGAERFDADVASGPVLRNLPSDSSLLAQNSMFAARAQRPDGPITMIDGAQNMALSRGILTRLSEPWFDPSLGLIGGEDHHFFRRIQVLGARFVWCGDAVVVEPPASDRLTTRSIVRRAFRSNVITAQTDVALLGRAAVLAGITRGWGITARNLAAGAVRRDPSRIVRTGLDAVALTGRMVGSLVGRRTDKRHGDY